MNACPPAAAVPPGASPAAVTLARLAAVTPETIGSRLVSGCRAVGLQPDPGYCADSFGLTEVLTADPDTLGRLVARVYQHRQLWGTLPKLAKSLWVTFPAIGR